MGLVYVAVAGLGPAVVRRFLWPGDRSENKRSSAGAALEMLLAQAAAEERRVSVRGAAEIGAGLAPARPARPIRPGERIHVVGAQGAGASAAALLAAWAGAEVDGCDPGRAFPVHAGARRRRDRRRRDATTRPTSRREPHPGRLAVTKALTAIDPDNAELVAARAARRSRSSRGSRSWPTPPRAAC